jgi:hypothetical protein
MYYVMKNNSAALYLMGQGGATLANRTKKNDSTVNKKNARDNRKVIHLIVFILLQPVVCLNCKMSNSIDPENLNIGS